MNQTTPILYSGFYDFPLAFTARWEENLYVFVRDFDDDLDEYEDQYRVFLLPSLTDEEIQSSWLRIENRAIESFGKVAVKDVRFDSTHRKEIDSTVLQALTAPREVALR